MGTLIRAAALIGLAGAAVGVAVCAGCAGRDSARASDRLSQPGSEDGVPADLRKSDEELAVERARAAKYPENRDYRGERTALIVAAAGGWGHDTNQGWPLFRTVVAQVSGVSAYALQGSPVLRKFESEHTGVPVSGDDLLWAAGGKRPELGPELAAEGERVIDQFLGSNLPKILDSIADERRFFPPTDPAEPAAATLLPYLGDARSTARFNGGRMLLAAKRGDEKELIRAARHNYAVSRGCAAEAITIAHLVAVAIDALTITRFTELNLEKPLSPMVCEKLLEITTENPGPNFEVSMRGEGLFCMDTINWIYTKGSIRDLTGETEGVVESLKEAGQRAAWVTREAALEQAEDYFTNLGKMFDPDDAVAKAAGERTYAIAKNAKDDIVFRATHTPFVQMVGSAEAIVRQERMSRSQRGAFRAMVAVELYKHQHGAYPESLGQIKDFVGDLPRDWFAKDGAAIRYKRIDPTQDRLKRSYLLYSVSSDGVDNGGTEDPKHFTASLTGPKKDGLDLVFNFTEAPADEESR